HLAAQFAVVGMHDDRLVTRVIERKPPAFAARFRGAVARALDGVRGNTAEPFAGVDLQVPGSRSVDEVLLEFRLQLRKFLLDRLEPRFFLIGKVDAAETEIA